jgi:uncharacterized protein YndB with AHSA1/START domain
MSRDDPYHDTAMAIERIDRDLLIPAHPEDVWTVITGDGWLAEEVQLELRPGGEARFSDPESVRTGWVEEVSPPEFGGAGRLVFWWGPDGEPATRVELTVEPEGALTRLRVVESRPLEVLDLVGLPLPEQSQGHGPAMLAVA